MLRIAVPPSCCMHDTCSYSSLMLDACYMQLCLNHAICTLITYGDASSPVMGMKHEQKPVVTLTPAWPLCKVNLSMRHIHKLTIMAMCTFGHVHLWPRALLATCTFGHVHFWPRAYVPLAKLTPKIHNNDHVPLGKLTIMATCHLGYVHYWVRAT